jgi:hypothetical protein
MDVSETTAPKSDQQNFDDYLGGSKTVTVSEVKAGSTEQPVEVHLVEFPGRPFKPSKSMRRVLVAAWGSDSSAYTGRQMTLFGDPEVRFGGQAVGGIRISHLSHLPKPLTVSLTVTRGKRAPFVVQPLTVRDWLTELAAVGGDVDLIGALGKAARAAGANADVLDKIRDAYQKAQKINRGEIETTETEEE